MHAHQLFEHPLFEERPVKDILEPFGFLVHIDNHEFPDELDGGEDYTLYSTNLDAFIDSLENHAPKGFIEVARFENEDGPIIVSVFPHNIFSRLMLMADTSYGPAALSDVIQERLDQHIRKNFTPERDDHYMKGELARAAGSYASIAGNAIERGASDTSNMLTTDWPFDRAWWKPTTPRRDLVKAGALILAEIERLDRAAAYAKAGEDAE